MITIALYKLKFGLQGGSKSWRTPGRCQLTNLFVTKNDSWYKWLEEINWHKNWPTLENSHLNSLMDYPLVHFPFSFTALSLNLLECLHFCINSVFMLMHCASAFKIHSFSDKQTSHLLDPHVYGLHFFKISHLIVGVSPLSLSLHT